MLAMWRDPESRKALLLALWVGLAGAFVLGGYEYIRSPSNTLYKAYFGKENLPMVMAVVPLGVMAFVFAYGRLLSWFGPLRTLNLITLVSVVIMLLCWYGIEQFQSRVLVFFLYIFRSAYVVLLIEQYWSLLNSSLKTKEAAILFGPICGISSIGAITAGTLGSYLTGYFGTHNMLVIAAFLTAPALIFSSLAYMQARKLGFEGRNVKDLSKQEDSGTSILGMKSLVRNKTLIFILLIILLTQGVASSLGLVFQGLLQDMIPDPDLQTAFSFKFYAWVNSAAAIGQWGLTPLLLARFQPRTIQIVIPLVLILGVLCLIFEQSLWLAGGVFLLFKAMDYSVFRASKETFYIPMDFAERFRAKEFIDIFGYRLGKGLTSGCFALMVGAGILIGEGGYAMVSLLMCVGWSVMATRLKKQ
jgi:ATP:ADP antiporter, AAA family